MLAFIIHQKKLVMELIMLEPKQKDYEQVVMGVIDHNHKFLDN